MAGPGPGTPPPDVVIPFTRYNWAYLWLEDLGNPKPDPRVVDWVAGWTSTETAAPGGAHFNLLNTEQKAPGSWDFNPQGVQNYPDQQTGFDANAQVLHNGLYNPLLQALQTNDYASLGMGGNTMSYGVERSLTNWVKGPGDPNLDVGYAQSVVNNATDNVAQQRFTYADLFGVVHPGGSNNNTGNGPGPQGTNPFGLPTVAQMVYFFKRVALFLLGVTLFAVGFVLLFHQAAEAISGQALDAIPDLGESEKPAPPAADEKPATPDADKTPAADAADKKPAADAAPPTRRAPPVHGGKSQNKQQERGKKVQKLAKLAEMAA